MTTETPWGPAETAREIAPGIIHYGTASHGGYYVAPERVAQMPPPLRDFQPFAGPNFYEQDCDWSIVALAFPQSFPSDALAAAAETLQHYRPELYREMAKQSRAGEHRAAGGGAGRG